MSIQQISAAEAALQKGAQGVLYQDSADPSLFYVRGATGPLSENALRGVASPLTAAQVAATQAAAAAGLWNLNAAPAAGLVAGVETSAFTFTADTSQRIIGLAVVFNAASDQQAAEQIAAGLYSTYPLDSAEALVMMSPGVAIERIAVVALSSTTYATGFCISPTETTVATILSALRFIVAPSVDAVALNLSSVPSYTAGLVSSAIATVTFSEAA